MEAQKNSVTECCPQFDPAPWEDKTLNWEGKKFIKDKVRTVFYMPLNFGQVMRRCDKLIREAGGNVVENIGLSDHTSAWNMDIYIAVDKEIPGGQNTTLSGKFFSKVYEGPYKDTGKWMKDAVASTRSKGMEINKWFMWYTTCPKCAKKYGKNYVVVLGEVE